MCYLFWSKLTHPLASSYATIGLAKAFFLYQCGKVTCCKWKWCIKPLTKPDKRITMQLLGFLSETCSLRQTVPLLRNGSWSKSGSKYRLSDRAFQQWCGLSCLSRAGSCWMHWAAVGTAGITPESSEVYSRDRGLWGSKTEKPCGQLAQLSRGPSSSPSTLLDPHVQSLVVLPHDHLLINTPSLGLVLRWFCKAYWHNPKMECCYIFTLVFRGSLEK